MNIQYYIVYIEIQHVSKYIKEVDRLGFRFFYVRPHPGSECGVTFIFFRHGPKQFFPPNIATSRLKMEIRRF